MTDASTVVPSKSFITAKTGPLPNWAWGGLILGGMLAVSSWQKNKTKTPAATATIGGQPLPSDIVPRYTFVDESTSNINIPPMGGPPVTPPPAPTPPPNQTPPPPPDSGDPCDPASVMYDQALCDLLNGNTPPPPAPPPPPPPAPPPPPPGQWVQVVPWQDNPAPGTPSSLWGISEMMYGNGQAWPNIWNAPQNAQLASMRGDPKNIQPGDQFWVPQ